MEARVPKKGPFKSFYEFCERVDLSAVNRRVIESLIKSGRHGQSGRHPRPIDAR